MNIYLVDGTEANLYYAETASVSGGRDEQDKRVEPKHRETRL
jgi:hypothetical protein